MKWLRRRATGEILYWQDLLTRLGVPGITVRDVIKTDGGYAISARGRLDPSLRPDLARRLAVHKRLPQGAVHVEDDPPGGSAGDFIIHVRLALLAAARGPGD